MAGSREALRWDNDPQLNSLEVRRLLTKLHNAMDKHGQMEAHMVTIFQLRDRLARLKHEVQEEDMKTALLNSMPSNLEYRQVSSAVRYGLGTAVTPDRLREMILLAEAEVQEEEATSKSRGGGDGADKSKGISKSKGKDTNKQRAKSSGQRASSGKCCGCG